MSSIYKDILYDYQKKAVDLARDKDSFFLAMEPGTGKTYTSLSIVQEKGFEKIIVVCQKSKLYDWQRDVEKTLGLKTYVLEGNKNKDLKTLEEFKEGALISSYGTIWRRNVPLDKDIALIIDESQYFKGKFRGKTSNLSKWGVETSKLVGLVLLLSGTPTNEPVDLFWQLKMLGMTLDRNDFSKRFLIEKEVKYPGSRWPVKVIAGYRNLEELYGDFDKIKFSIRAEDAIGLPEQNFIWMDLKHDNKKIYDYVMKEKVYNDIEIPSDGVLFMYARQLSSGFIKDEEKISHHKENALKELLESNINNFVVFYNYIRELEDIKSICKELDIKVFESNGETKNDDLSNDYDGRFIIAAQYQSSAEGKNWQHLNHQIYYSPPISFMKYKQSLARVHRIGQEKHVFYYFFKTIGTVETKIYKNIKKGIDYDAKIFEEDMKKGGV